MIYILKCEKKIMQGSNSLLFTFFQRNVEKYYKSFKKIVTICSAFAGIIIILWFLSQYLVETKELLIPTPFPVRKQSPDYEIAITIFFFLFLTPVIL